MGCSGEDTQNLFLGDHSCSFLFFLSLILGPILPSHSFSFPNTPEFLQLVTKKAGIQTQVCGLQSPSSWAPDTETNSQQSLGCGQKSLSAIRERRIRKGVCPFQTALWHGPIPSPAPVPPQGPPAISGNPEDSPSPHRRDGCSLSDATGQAAGESSNPQGWCSPRALPGNPARLQLRLPTWHSLPKAMEAGLAGEERRKPA